MRRLPGLLAAIIVIGLAVFWYVTHPQTLSADALEGLKPDLKNGELVFWAGGCSSCHADADAKDADKLKLGGGQKFPSPFGTFRAPNISPDPDAGIGKWTVLDLANAMTKGVRPDGQHLYPVFPYASYANMTHQDIVDLYAYMQTLPKVSTPSQPHEVGFPFNLRRLLGGWKWLNLGKGWVVTGDLTPAEQRGRYLVEGPGHCGECHTPRDALGGLERGKWLAGAPIPGEKGNFPNITPGKLKWSEADIAEYLNSGFTPDYDSAGGHMALVVQNMAHLPESDRAAIAAYLKKVSPVP